MAPSEALLSAFTPMPQVSPPPPGSFARGCELGWLGKLSGDVSRSYALFTVVLEIAWMTLECLWVSDRIGLHSLIHCLVFLSDPGAPESVALKTWSLS